MNNKQAAQMILGVFILVGLFLLIKLIPMLLFVLFVGGLAFLLGWTVVVALGLKK